MLPKDKFWSDKLMEHRVERNILVNVIKRDKLATLYFKMPHTSFLLCFTGVTFFTN